MNIYKISIRYHNKNTPDEFEIEAESHRVAIRTIIEGIEEDAPVGQITCERVK